MVFRLIITIYLYLYYLSISDGRFVRALQSNQTIQYPTNELEIQALVKHAYQHGSTNIRVIGSGHSYKKAIYDEQGMNNAQKLIILSLDKYHGVTIDKKNNVAVVKAGTIIGPNPELDNENIEESLVWILDRTGYAVPALAGIARQTVAGFLSTGSSGGSLLYSFYDALVGIRMIDGKGIIRDISKEDCKFHAVGVSMGLLGIITSVNISLTTKSYYIKGLQTTSPISPISSNLSTGCPLDIFGDGNKQFPSLTEFFKTSGDYSRVIWYPQKDFDRSVIWVASRYNRRPLLPIVPYQQFPEPNITVGSLGLVDALTTINVFAADTEEAYSLVYSILDQVQPIGEQKFFDKYYDSLCMDNKLSFKILPFSFSELWIPIGKAKAVMNVLRNYYLSHGVNATGNAPFEIYTSGKSQFWLSPSYGRDVVRFDWYWFNNNPNGNASHFFQQFWDLLKPFDYRCHWGKYLPDDYKGPRLHKLYPMLKKWLKIRDEMDPGQIFVTQYWRNIFSIKTLQK